MIHSLGKRFVFVITLALAGVLALPISAQTAQKVEDLLNQPAISWSAAARFALEAAEKATLDNPDEAFQFAASRNWLPKNSVASGNARLNGVALLLINAFDLSGGLLYSLVKNPHYAYRELVYKEVIQGKADPEMTVSGQQFLFMINRILAIRDAGSEKAAADAARISEREAARARAEQEKLAQEINTQLEAQQVADTKASVTTEGVTISLTNIQFMANSAELTEPEKAKLREIARILQTVSERNLLVVGHTALAGNPEAQLRTSIERAQAVADYLVSLGARSRAELTVQGYGSERPIADNTTEQGMAQNRRVEITIIRTAGNR
jgi:outer membrane protein OmpA-like peptidoglycan-associated protein